MCLEFCQNSDITPITHYVVLGIFCSTHADMYAVLCRGPCLYLTLWRFDFSYLAFYFLAVCKLEVKYNQYEERVQI